MEESPYLAAVRYIANLHAQGHISTDLASRVVDLIYDEMTWQRGNSGTVAIRRALAGYGHSSGHSKGS